MLYRWYKVQLFDHKLCFFLKISLLFSYFAEIVSESCLFSPSLLWHVAFKKCLYISFVHELYHTSSFWPFFPLNVNNFETDKLPEQSIPNSLRMKSVWNLLTSELASTRICFWLIFTWPLKSWHLTCLRLGLHGCKPSHFRDFVLPI